jgi:hypothetical protein
MKFKKRYLQEMDDTINELFGALSKNANEITPKDAFEYSGDQNLDDQNAKSLLNFATRNNIPGNKLRDVAANLASGVGKTMDDREALNIYDKATSGPLEKHEAHALQNFFTRHDTSQNPQVDNLMRGLGKNPTRHEITEHFKKLIEKGEIPEEERSFVKRHLLEKMDHVKGIKRHAYKLYPSVMYGKNAPDDLLDIAREARIEKFGSDDPEEIIIKMARDSGDLKYEDPGEFLVQNEGTLQQLDQARATWKESNPGVTFDSWLKENDPETYEKMKNLNDEIKRIDKWQEKYKWLQKNTKSIYDRLNNI